MITCPCQRPTCPYQVSWCKESTSELQSHSRCPLSLRSLGFEFWTPNGQVMTRQAPRDSMWWLWLMLLDPREFAFSHLLCAYDPFPWKAWRLGRVSDLLMTWKICPFLIHSELLSIIPNVILPCPWLSPSGNWHSRVFSSEVMETGGEPTAMAIQEANSGFH